MKDMDDGKIKILVIDDDPTFVQLIKVLIGAVDNSYGFECVGLLSEGMRRLSEERFDLVLLDLNLPDSRELDTVRTFINMNKTEKNIPVIVMTGHEDEKCAVESLRMGAEDYIPKSHITPQVLARSLRYAIERNRMRNSLTESLLKARTSEELLSKTNRTLRMRSGSNRAVFHANTEPELFREICKVCAEIGGYPLNWIGLAAHDTDRTVLPVAQWGDETGYLDFVKVSWGEGKYGNGPMGTAIRNRTPSLLKDITADPNNIDWRHEAVKRGLVSIIVLPLFVGGEVFGAWCIYSSNTDAFTDEEVAILTELAEDLSYGIRTLRANSERRRAEKALLESEQRTRSIVENTFDGVVTIDKRGIITSINPAVMTMFGYSCNEVVGQNVKMLMPEPFKGQHDVYLANYMDTGEKKIIGADREVLGQKKDGTMFPIDLRVGEYSLGDERQYLGTIRDITERKRTEKEREKYVGRLSKLHEMSQNISSSLDIDEILDFTVHAAAELLDVPHVVLFTLENEQTLKPRGDHAGWLVGQEGRKFSVGNKAVGKVAQTGVSVYIKNVVESPDWTMKEKAKELGIGSYLGVPLKSGSRVIGVLGCMAQGIQEFTLDEIELITTFAHGAATAIENAEAHSRLEEAFKELEESQRMIVRAEKLSSLGVLTAGAAHEILNPANIIGLHGQRMMWEYEEESPEYEMATVIMRNVERITRICDDLRRFSRDEKPQQESFNFHTTILECVRPLESEMRLSEIEVNLDLPEEEQIVMGDKSQLMQVLMNLISNAVDAMPDGGNLSITSEIAIDEDLECWEIRVADTGCGIPEDALSKIFDPFFTTKPEDKGTGLGLSVSFGIVEDHGGKLWAESVTGEGTTFILRLPVEREIA